MQGHHANSMVRLIPYIFFICSMILPLPQNKFGRNIYAKYICDEVSIIYKQSQEPQEKLHWPSLQT